jgi:hypothetical protein
MFNNLHEKASPNNLHPLKGSQGEAYISGISYETFLKCSNEILMSVLSLVPYTVFRVKVDSGKDLRITTNSKTSLYKNLSNFLSNSNPSQTNLSQIGEFTWSNGEVDLISYSARKNLFFAKSQL